MSYTLAGKTRQSEQDCSYSEDLFKRAADFADMLLCPSEFVADGVRALCPKHAHKVRICPYGNSINYGGRTSKPVKGRFFWAGGDWVRKGLHYMAEAADVLKKIYHDMEFRVAGITDTEVVNMKRFRSMTFLGKLDKRQMKDEFINADAFVFPTLSEGMAGVIIEAIAAGCPVITTKAAGIDSIEDGVSGLIVPVRDVKAIVLSIERLYLDRELRDRIALATKNLASLYTEEAWGRRLIELIREI